MTGLLDVAERVWPVLLFLALIQVVADLCDDAGLFDVSAHVAARVAGGSRLRLFLLFTLLATVCTWVLSIDTTAVLLAPIGLALAAELGLAALPFAFASVWLANSASLLLPGLEPDQPAGPVAPRRGRGGVRARSTWLPQLAVLVVVLVVLLVRHRVALRGSYDVPRVLPSYDPVLLWRPPRSCVGIGPAIVPASRPGWWRSPVGGAGRSASSYAAPQSVAPGSAGPTGPVVGDRLRRSRCSPSSRWSSRRGRRSCESLFGTRRLARVAVPAGRLDRGAGQRDQQPAGVPRRRAVRQSTDRLVTALVAVNVGPMLLAWGSLANLLWLRACRTRGLEISMVRFGLEGLLVVPLAVAAGVLAVSLRVSRVSAELNPVSPGVVRVSWTVELQEQGSARRRPTRSADWSSRPSRAAPPGSRPTSTPTTRPPSGSRRSPG